MDDTKPVRTIRIQAFGKQKGSAVKNLCWMAVFLLVIGTVSAVSHAAPKNIIRNSSFEQLTEDGIPRGWNVGEQNIDAISIDRTASPHGRNSVHIVFDGKKTFFSQQQYFELNPGTTCTFSAWVKTKNLQPAAEFQLMVMNLGWSFGSETKLTMKSPNSGWKRYKMTFIVPAANQNKYNGQDNVLYKVMVHGPKGIKGEVWIDAVQLEVGRAATAYEPLEGKTAPSANAEPVKPARSTNAAAPVNPARSANAGPVNFIGNSSFEQLTEEGIPRGWNIPEKNFSAISIDRTAAPHGRNSVRIVFDGKETFFNHRKYFKLKPDRICTFSAYVRTKNLQPSDGLQLSVINLGWSFGSQTMLPVKLANSDWTRYTKTFVVPAASQFKYNGQDNVEYTVMVRGPKGLKGEVWIDALQLEVGRAATDYKPLEGKTIINNDLIAEAVGKRLKQGGRMRYFQVKDPLFTELLSDQRGPDRVLYYGYHDLNAKEVYRPYAKKFGHRYVQEEQLKELRTRPFVPMTNAWPRGGVGSYATMRMIQRPEPGYAKGVAPAVIGADVWIMDPRYEEYYLQTAIKLAKQSLDKSPGNEWGNTWGLWAGDEVFECKAIMVVPKDKRYDYVLAADKEIREQFGFGKYGMPDFQEDPNPFKKIAYARWCNAKLTALYKKTYEQVKKINPKLVMLGPDPCGGVPPVDLEAMTPYFDMVSNQSWYSPNPFTQQLATGADTKAMVDLSACPVWALVQHTAANDPEAMREQFSQVYRNGGHGLVILGVEWYDRELEHPKFINPAKWRALLEITDTITKMNTVKIPTADTALLYASDTYQTFESSPKMADPRHPQAYAAYAALGPQAQSWFHFVSDRQIDRGQKNLKDYKVLYIPLATYQRSAVLDKIEAYVRNGGIVVCTDPTAFTWDVNGEDLSARWSRFAGVRRGKPRSGPNVIKTVSSPFLKGAKEMAVEVLASGVELTPADDSTKPFAVFGDGVAAATIRPVGKGYVIFFGVDPFGSGDRNTPMGKLVRNIQIAAGAQVAQDIWRFKLPPFKTVSLPDTEKALCLTNNNVVLKGNDANLVHCLAVNGTYTYDRFPTGIADSAANGEIPFDKGHLMNCRAAYMGRAHSLGRNPVELEKWIVSWTDRDAINLTLDLKKPYALNRVRLVYSGALPKFKVLGSNDGAAWVSLGSRPARPLTENVPDLTVALKDNYRYVRLAFTARKTAAVFELSELQLWGNEAK